MTAATDQDQPRKGINKGRLIGFLVALPAYCPVHVPACRHLDLDEVLALPRGVPWYAGRHLDLDEVLGCHGYSSRNRKERHGTRGTRSNVPVPSAKAMSAR
jgi:hypothetical protein